MVSSIGIRAVALLLALSSAALSQQPPSAIPIATTIEPSTIAYIPRLAKAVLAGDQGLVFKALEEREDVNERVRAKEGARAGFTPIILAAAVSDPSIARVLIKFNADVTAVDDFNRSAFWYAAIHESVLVTEALMSAPVDAKKVINTADADLKRTPLHLAVRGDAPELVRILVAYGASQDQKDILGETPADYCKRRPNAACTELSSK